MGAPVDPDGDLVAVGGDDSAGGQEPALGGAGVAVAYPGRRRRSAAQRVWARTESTASRPALSGDRAGERAGAEGGDGFGEALPGVHPPGAGLDDLAPGSAAMS